MAELLFDAASHTYTHNGDVWPSVTQILDPLLELDGIPKDALRAAAEFGSHVHLACDLFDQGRLDEPALDMHLVPYLAAWKQFLFDSKAQVLDSEIMVNHSVLRYAGTLDKRIKWFTRSRTTRNVLDIKSGAVVPWTVGLQTEAYRQCLLDMEEDADKVRFCVHLKPDATYRLSTHRDPTDAHYFNSVLNVHNLRKQHGRNQSG